MNTTRKQKGDTLMDPALRLRAGQQELTPAQEAEATRFAEACIQTQLSTVPVNEHEAEAFLLHVYEVAGQRAPRQVEWVDGPLQLVTLLATHPVGSGVRDSAWDTAWDTAWATIKNSVLRRFEAHLWDQVWNCVESKVRVSVGGIVSDHSARGSVGVVVQASVRESTSESLQASVRQHEDYVRESIFPGVDPIRAMVDWEDLVWGMTKASVLAYHEVHWLACYAFFDIYFAPNEFHTWICFNALVSGYWLGKEIAIIVRRPRVLSRDAEGRLHSVTGQCVAYHDGWGCYAWHGVRVSEKVILAPETLTHEDFLTAPTAAVRRVIQERMGVSFEPE